MGLYDKYQNLKEPEKAFLWLHPIAAAEFNANATVALEEAQKRFGQASLHNGSGDAFRHCFWSAMNARDEGAELAEAFGKAHESDPRNPPKEKAMDLFNNSVGFEIGKNLYGASARELAVLCVQAWTERKLLQIDVASAGDLTYSNSTERYLYEER